MTRVIFSAESCLAVAYLNLTYGGKNNQLKVQAMNNRASKLEKIKNTELQQKLFGSYF